MGVSQRLSDFHELGLELKNTFDEISLGRLEQSVDMSIHRAALKRRENVH